MADSLANAIPPGLIILAVVLWICFGNPRRRIRVEEIGTHPWRVAVYREDGQPDRVLLDPPYSDFDCLLDPDEALALAGFLDAAASHCNAPAPARPKHVG